MFLKNIPINPESESREAKIKYFKDKSLIVQEWGMSDVTLDAYDAVVDKLNALKTEYYREHKVFLSDFLFWHIFCGSTVLDKTQVDIMPLDTPGGDIERAVDEAIVASLE